jgi:hypothetical protein
MTTWRCTSRARSAGKACRSAATTMPTTWETPALWLRSGERFPGIDTISRDKNDFSDYYLHHQIDFSPRFRQETFASFFLDNSGYTSPYGFSYEKDLRGQFETRSIISIAPWYTAAFGVSLAREEVKNTYISDDNNNSFPLKRDDAGIYWENRFQAGSRFFFNAGVRGEIIDTPFIPEDLADGRPPFPANTMTKVNPKLAATYVLRTDRGALGSAVAQFVRHGDPAARRAGTRVHQQSGAEAGAHGQLRFRRRAARPSRQAVAGRDLLLQPVLRSDRLAGRQPGGAERLSNRQPVERAGAGRGTVGRYRPARWMSVAASYTYLDSEVLSLNGSTGLAPIPFSVGQELIRRPANSGSFVSTSAVGGFRRM